MIENINLKEIEKQTYRFTFQDGLYDIAYGCLLFFIAIAPILREIIYLWYILFLVLPASLILILGKRYISIPRIGVVKFRLKRTEAKNKIHLLAAILFPITVIMVVLTFLGMFNITLGGYIVPVGAGIFALVLLSVVGYILDYSHFYLYAISIGLGIPLAEILRLIISEPYDYLISFGISGILILIFGLITLVRFIKKYPITSEEALHVKG
jgi:hypothetical protein